MVFEEKGPKTGYQHPRLTISVLGTSTATLRPISTARGVCMSMTTSQSSHSPPEHRCPAQPIRAGEGAVAHTGAPARSMCVRKVSILRAPPPAPVQAPTVSVHFMAEQNQRRFRLFPTQPPGLALFPVFIFVHILVLFYGRTPQTVPTCSTQRLSRWKVCGLGRRPVLRARAGSAGGGRQGLPINQM